MKHECKHSMMHLCNSEYNQMFIYFSNSGKKVKLVSGYLTHRIIVHACFWRLWLLADENPKFSFSEYWNVINTGIKTLRNILFSQKNFGSVNGIAMYCTGYQFVWIFASMQHDIEAIMVLLLLCYTVIIWETGVLVSLISTQINA